MGSQMSERIHTRHPEDRKHALCHVTASISMALGATLCGAQDELREEAISSFYGGDCPSTSSGRCFVTPFLAMTTRQFLTF